MLYEPLTGRKLNMILMTALNALRGWLRGCSYKSFIRSDYFILLSLALAYIIIVSGLAVRGHYSFYTNAWDLGIYAQALYSTLNHGRLLYYTAELAGNPSGSLFGIHFMLFLLFLTPVYAIYQNPITLLILRPLAISMGLIPLYWIMRGNGITRKLIILLSAAYLVYPPTLTPIFNFDILSFLPALFLFALHYFRKGDYLKSYLFMVLALTVNEFVSLIVAATSIYVLLVDWRGNLRALKGGRINKNMVFSAILLFTGISWFILACSIITYFNPLALKTKWEWGELGGGPAEIILNILANPLKALGILFNDGQRKFLYIVSLFGPLAFIPFLEPFALIMAMPWLAASLLSINPLYYSIESQYPAFVSPFIFVAAIDGIKKLMRFNVNITGRIAVMMALMLLFSSLLIPPGIQSGIFEPDGKREAIWLALREIPPNASVSIMPDVYPHVCNRLEAYPYFVEGVDYVLINVYSWWYDVILPRPAHTATRWCDVEVGDDYGIVLNMNGVILYKRGYNGEVKFSGVKFSYGIHDVTDSAGKIISIRNGTTVINVLAHKPTNQSTLFFRTSSRYLPSGKYNVTMRLMKPPSASDMLIRVEVRTRPGEVKILVKEFSGEHLPPYEWRDLGFSFSIKRPMPIEIAVYAYSSEEIYFHNLSIVQVSGA
ncbi:MAG: DUF2079 domain-containing protein [Candidatus Bathyarchaeota archaeon]|nr:DUF2079 domain-containing protein [Candidatus Bathyarchaeota archaeon]